MSASRSQLSYTPIFSCAAFERLIIIANVFFFVNAFFHNFLFKNMIVMTFKINAVICLEKFFEFFQKTY